MFHPKRTKHSKQQKLRNKNLSYRGSILSFGDIGLKAIQRGFLSSNQIEAARNTISQILKREGKVWIRVFPNKSRTTKPLETRMGKGKGKVNYWCCDIKPGRIIYEISKTSISLAKIALKIASSKLPVSCNIILKFNYLNNE